MEFSDVRVAVDKLPPDQGEALVLIGAAGMSYEEAAEICDCAVGTVKSRVNRARVRLAEVLSIESVAEFGPDVTPQPIVTSPSTRRSAA